MPASQAVQEVAPGEDRVPAAQVMQAEPERYFPAAHAKEVALAVGVAVGVGVFVLDAEGEALAEAESEAGLQPLA